MVGHVRSVKEYFDTLPQRFRAEAARAVSAVFQLELDGEGGGTYHVTVERGTMAVAVGPHPAPSATLKMRGDDYVRMVNGEINGATAFMKGLMQVVGSVLIAQQMQAIIPPLPPAG